MFALGVIVATPRALAALRHAGQSPADFLRQHAAGDWGQLDDHDRAANWSALREGGRLLSAYTTVRGDRLWVITEADRSSTCLLLPEEY